MATGSSPRSTLTALWHGLKTAPTLTGWAEVLLGARFVSVRGGPRRVVLVPQGGQIDNARVNDNALRDVDRQVAARLWAGDIDELCELEARFIQALDYQASPKPLDPAGPAGVFWKTVREEWDQEIAADKDGEALDLILEAICPIDRVPQAFGQVDSTSLSTLTTTVAVQMAPLDDNATVASTSGLPPFGIVAIDAEQIRYTAIVGSKLLGLVRGVNLTTPATHLVGAVVTVVAP